jgi:hypothetical protein
MDSSKPRVKKREKMTKSILLIIALMTADIVEERLQVSFIGCREMGPRLSALT